MTVNKNKSESLTAPYIKKDKNFYLNTVEIEESMLKKAINIAERLMVAFMRENKVEVKVDASDIADKIIDKIIDKLPQQQVIYMKSNETEDQPATNKKSNFKLDDTPVVVKTEKVEIKGKIGSTSISKDNINSSLDALDDFVL